MYSVYIDCFKMCGVYNWKMEGIILFGKIYLFNNVCLIKKKLVKNLKKEMFCFFGNYLFEL